MGVLWDALSTAGNLLSAPGDYTRGLLAGRPGERATARNLMSSWGLADPNDDSWLGTARDLGVGFLTDPLTYAGGAAARLAGQGASKIPGLLGLRRNFSMAHGVDEAGQAASILGGSPAQQVGAENLSSLLRQNAAGSRGVYTPEWGAGAALREAGQAGSRHETMHGLIDAAAKSGDYAGLGPLGKSAAWLQSGAGDTGVRAGLAALVDETAGHAAEAKGALGQALSAGKFLFGGTPWRRAGYAGDFAQLSPAVGAAYTGLGYVPMAAAGGVAGAGAYGAGQAMWG